MLRIYDDQSEAFARASTRDYEQRMVKHLRGHFPEQTRSLDEQALLETIRHGVARAKSHGVLSEHDVGLYLNLVMALGRDFDRDPRIPWAQAILTGTELPDASWRMARLYRTTIERTQVPVPGDDAYVD